MDYISLIMYYPLNEMSGQQLHDISILGNTTTVP